MSESNHRREIVFFVNHERIVVSDEKVFLTFAEFIRYQRALPGTKIVCAEGDCGACTVLKSSSHPNGLGIYRSVNSCIIPLYLLDGCHIITVEGVQEGEALHPVQESMAKHHGGQCGYCTPGFVCAMSALAEETILSKKQITEKKARNYLTGNLCRCTGYEPILKAATTLDLKGTKSFQERYRNSDRDNEIAKNSRLSVRMETKQGKVFLPTTIEEAVGIKAKYPEVRIVAGATDIGVVVNKGKLDTPVVMSLALVKDLFETRELKQGLWIGSQVTLSQLETWLERKHPEMAKILHIFASPQIKNQATLVGNVVNGSPIADSIPFLMAMDAKVIIQSQKGQREEPLREFYLGYKQLKLEAHELVVGVEIPNLQKDEFVKLYKVSTRKDLDISAVTLAIFIRGDGLVQEARVVLGGVGPTVRRFENLEKILLGQKMTEALIFKVAAQVELEIKPLTDVRGSKEFRLQLGKNLFLKYAHELRSEGRL